MTDDTYTHRPGQVESDREDGDSDATTDHAAPIERGKEEWDWRGWVLVGVIVFSFLVVPAVILLLPPVAPFRFAYLVLPMIPAILLGLVAVWSAQRSN
ncbi:hypothetical protein [Halorussus amylolyticus]|uniref:hypothetical protein n=1 Tax=Halorussus amylolyticus TaxID=1126242 RepID=UPI00192F761B|nr:hypothetical protein [Halorussus amylolyticus]